MMFSAVSVVVYPAYRLGHSHGRREDEAVRGECADAAYARGEYAGKAEAYAEMARRNHAPKQPRAWSGSAPGPLCDVTSQWSGPPTHVSSHSPRYQLESVSSHQPPGAYGAWSCETQIPVAEVPLPPKAAAVHEDPRKNHEAVEHVERPSGFVSRFEVGDWSQASIDPGPDSGGDR